ncbi:hypothetical protein GWI33_002327 [Rhynchophorus ferrugineus]|uniref:MORN repeat-containing protein 3 n=1 Tax=Rhynchophorus ferrugineus TaxID=354439 RepID=A0A834IRV7_RHYFE|nr:hypothetical protein GWI33_002327 [Rhynchophorus ferrugineus]
MPFLKFKNHAPSRSRKLENLSKKDGLKHAIFNTVGDKYIGQWKDNKKNGKGVIWTRNDELYEGDMERNYRHGFGVLAKKIANTDVYGLSYRDGSFYIGEFRYGKRHGHGTQWFPDGAFFDGHFENDLRYGIGVFIKADGNRYEGEWLNDLKHGEGLYFHLTTGQVQEGIWNKGWCVHSTMRDIQFKQCSIRPMTYPFEPNALKYLEKVIAIARHRALLDVKEPCGDDGTIIYEYIEDDSDVVVSYTRRSQNKSNNSETLYNHYQ